MDNINWLNREEMLIGKESINKLKNSNVIVFGLGGVGSYVVEGLVRVGIGNITIVDKDIVDITNINRQLIADTETVGMAKVDAEKARILKINPQINVASIKEFVNKDNIENIFAIANNIILNNATTIENSGTKFKTDYVIDAIDTVSSKLEIIKYCHDKDIKIISCMGTGNKLDASRFEITDINYHEVTSGYVAIITCLPSDGRIQTALLPDWLINSDGLMTPPANRMKTKSNEIVYGGCIDDDGKMYGCRQASNSSCITCNFSLAEDPTSGELFFICGCHVGSGYCVKVRAA